MIQPVSDHDKTGSWNGIVIISG